MTTLTLLTHEWLRTRGRLLTVAGVAALLVAVGTLLAATGWAVISTIGGFGAVAAALAVIPVAQVLLAVDYWRSSYGREGYFTQTLPIAGPRIYRAKLLWAWTVTLGALAVGAALLLAAWPGIARGLGMPETNPFTVVGDLWSVATARADAWQILLGLGLTLVMFLVWPVQYYFAASFGSEAPRNRLGAGGPVLTWVVLYVVLQLASVLGLFLVPYAVGMVDGGLGILPFDALAELRAGDTSDDLFPLGVLPPILLITALCLWRTVRSWDRKVSLV